MFDCSSPINITAFTDSKKQLLTVRWPSDQEWDERFLGRKILIKRMGRGISETTIDSTAADAKLYEKIKLNGAPPLGPFESVQVIETLTTCEVTDVQFEGEEAEVVMQVLTGTVRHRLRIPSAEQAIKLTKATHVLNMPYNMQQVKIGVAFAAGIWDACKGHSEDYPSGVPAIHKDTAVQAVIAAIDREMGASNDERDF